MKKTRNKMAALLLSVAALVINCNAQVTTNEPTSLPTNAPVSTVVGFAFGLLPQWDKQAGYFTNASEIEVRVAPLWKTASASGSTPYLSFGGDYWFKSFPGADPATVTAIGVGGEMVTLGNGAGSDTVDSVNAFIEARRSIGNIAGYLMLGGGRDINGNRFNFQFGPGVEIRYKTGIGLFLDTRLVEPFAGGSSGKVDWLTRFGLSMHF